MLLISTLKVTERMSGGRGVAVQLIEGRRNITVGGNFKVIKTRTSDKPQVSDVLRLQALQLLCLVILIVLLAMLSVSQKYLMDEISEIRSTTERAHLAQTYQYNDNEG
jgi:hypothetical protein